MRLIHCTQKLLKELKNPPLQNPDTPNPEGLGNWYANLLRIDRRKCILFTSEKTLYSFLISKVKKENLENIVDEFLFNLNMNLQAEGFSLEVINKVIAEYTEIGFAKTANRQVLGVMNDFAYAYEYDIARAGGLDMVRIVEVNKSVNRTPSSPLKYKYPIDMLKELLSGVQVPLPKIVKT
jgi:Domain of unknown function (DUF6933)